MFFNVEFEISSRLGVLLFARFLRHRLYISWSKYVYNGDWKLFLVSITKPSKSCQGY